MTKSAISLVAFLLLVCLISACGKKGELRPPEGAPTELGGSK